MPRSPDSDTQKSHRSPFSWREEPNSYHVHDQVSAGVALVCRLLETRILQQRKHKYGLLTDFLTIEPLNGSTVFTLGQIPGHLGSWTKTISTVCCSNICFSDIFSDLVTKSVQCSLFWVYLSISKILCRKISVRTVHTYRPGRIHMHISPLHTESKAGANLTQYKCWF